MGEPSPYLDALEQRSRVPLGEGGAIREKLRGDCHLHTNWSDGGATVREMAATAIELGHECIVVTDHSARLTVAHGPSEERLAAQLDEIAADDDELAPLRILTGLEVDILVDGSLDMSEAMLSTLDLVVASIHSGFSMSRDDMTRRMVAAIANPHVDVIGHITNRKLDGRGRHPSDFDAEIVFAACGRLDTAVEINCRPERRDPREDLLELAISWDCPVVISTDAHAPGQLEWQAYGCDKAARLGVPDELVVNTYGPDELIAWTAA